ncbi:hypothetical protein SNEBB_010655 [Seison nebaliae]|nr:hypothetical protein SNEBB_010655 [Seison nebaliae]
MTKEQVVAVGEKRKRINRKKSLSSSKRSKIDKPRRNKRKLNTISEDPDNHTCEDHGASLTKNRRTDIEVITLSIDSNEEDVQIENEVLQVEKEDVVVLENEKDVVLENEDVMVVEKEEAGEKNEKIEVEKDEWGVDVREIPNSEPIGIKNYIIHNDGCKFADEFNRVRTSVELDQSELTLNKKHDNPLNNKDEEIKEKFKHQMEYNEYSSIIESKEKLSNELKEKNGIEITEKEEFDVGIELSDTNKKEVVDQTEISSAIDDIIETINSSKEVLNTKSLSSNKKLLERSSSHPSKDLLHQNLINKYVNLKSSVSRDNIHNTADSTGKRELDMRRHNKNHDEYSLLSSLPNLHPTNAYFSNEKDDCNLRDLVQYQINKIPKTKQWSEDLKKKNFFRQIAKPQTTKEINSKEEDINYDITGRNIKVNNINNFHKVIFGMNILLLTVLIMALLWNNWGENGDYFLAQSSIL